MWLVWLQVVLQAAVPLALLGWLAWACRTVSRPFSLRGTGYLLRRNFRVSREVTHGLWPDLTRVTFGIVTPF